MKTSSFFESNKKITLVDVCCGKGICSLLASYLFKNDTRISKILMMDKPNFTEKHNKGPADWAYIETINANAYTENRPKIETHQENLFESDKVMELLPCKDEQEEDVIALIGIHLCKNLSPAFIGLVNALGQDRVPFCCLALLFAKSGLTRRQERQIEPNKRQKECAKCCSIRNSATETS